MKKIILSIFLFSFIASSLPVLAASTAVKNEQDLNKKLIQIKTKQLATKNKIQKGKELAKTAVTKVMKASIAKKNTKK